MANDNLTQAKRAKKDEFYTQYPTIEREMNAYLDFDPNVFRDKTILLPCDDPEWSNFTRYFAANFDRFGIKKLISTSYAPSRRTDLFSAADAAGEEQTYGKLFVLDRDLNHDGRIDIDDLDWTWLEGDGDFRSAEVTALRGEADLIVTNPPFSLFREYISWIMAGNKRFVAIGNLNAITYTEVFPHIRSNMMWMGATGNGSDMVFAVPDGAEIRDSDRDKAARLGYVGNYTRLGNSCWFANIDHGRRHEPLQLMSMAENLRFNKKMAGKKSYDRYDNYDAIEVPFCDAIPNDYNGLMGVPITFLDKYCPEQFEIVGSFNAGSHGEEIGAHSTDTLIGGVIKKWNGPVVAKTPLYKRIIIRRIK